MSSLKTKLCRTVNNLKIKTIMLADASEVWRLEAVRVVSVSTPFSSTGHYISRTEAYYMSVPSICRVYLVVDWLPVTFDSYMDTLQLATRTCSALIRAQLAQRVYTDVVKAGDRQTYILRENGFSWSCDVFSTTVLSGQCTRVFITLITSIFGLQLIQSSSQLTPYSCSRFPLSFDWTIHTVVTKV